MSIDTQGLTPHEITELEKTADAMRQSRVLEREQRIASDRNGFRDLRTKVVALERRWEHFRGNLPQCPIKVVIAGREMDFGSVVFGVNVVPQWYDQVLFTVWNGCEPKYYLWARDSIPSDSGANVGSVMLPEGFDLPEVRAAYDELIGDVKALVEEIRLAGFQPMDFWEE